MRWLDVSSSSIEATVDREDRMTWPQLSLIECRWAAARRGREVPSPRAFRLGAAGATEGSRWVIRDQDSWGRWRQQRNGYSLTCYPQSVARSECSYSWHVRAEMT